MSGRIQLLSAALADQIAAGEVVERPSSVVKELVENALDAGARRVEVEIERGGLGRIVVSDDGEGMTVADAHLALRRHATSKLRTAEQLFSLESFGFRGEALPSIASISELRLVTRPPDQTAGYELVVRAGEVISAREVGAPTGTRIEVRELFANVPARLKFQKVAATEAGHVLDSLVRSALSAPEVHIRLRVDGRPTLELPSHSGLEERAQAVLRRTAGRGVRLASARLQEGPIVVEVHLAPPEESVLSARRVHLMVNRRLVRDRGLLAAVQVGMGDLLPRGRHPLAVVSLSLPPADVDVNVHPQKLEVRLARAAEAHAAIRHAVGRAVADAGFAPLPAETMPQRYAAEPARSFVARDEGEEVLAYGAERGRAYELVCAMADAAGQPPPAVVVAEPPPPRFLGVVPGGYLAFAEPAGLALVDQHVASALILSVLGLADARQPLSTPFALGEADLALARTHAPALAGLGFTVEGERLCTGATWAQGAGETFIELLAALREGGAEEAQARAITLAARSPSEAPDVATAMQLYAALRALVDDGKLPPLDEARWRGRRVRVLIPRAEIGQRLEG